MIEFPEQFNIATYFLDDRVQEGKGDKVAILFQNQRLTYHDVQRMANKFANILESLGVDPEDRVLISMPDSPEYVAALFGILKTGAVVVMLNPELKEDDISYFLSYTRAKVAIIHRDIVPKYEPFLEALSTLKNILVVGEAHKKLPSWDFLRSTISDDCITAMTHKDDSAIWLFSGGTTGQPKAVIQTHQSFANTTECYARRCIGYNENDITMSVPKLFFGYATGSNLFFPFSVGATTALFSERSTPEAIFENIKRFRPTILINVPTLINKLVQHPDAAKQDLSSLRLTTSAGEALPVELYNRWKKMYGVEILDGLGTAEMWHIFISNRLGDVKPGSIGKIVEGFEVKVCDEKGNTIADGETGFLWVAGNSRAIGYFQQMEKTQEVFIGRWYITGDLVRRDAGGYFFYEGRANDMVKVSGKWLSPMEVENCLLKHNAVKDCAVVTFVDADGLTRPKAFVELKSANGASENELQEFVKKNLEPYKYPRKVVFLDALPRTHLGKVDRKRLKEL